MPLFRCGEYYKKIDDRIYAKQWLLQQTPQKMFHNSRTTMTAVYFSSFFARSLVLQSPVPSLNSVHAFRCHMILELHEQELSSFTPPSIQANQYYAVEYQRSYYFGRALGSPDGDSFVSFKFLHSTVSSGERVLNWPRRDDIDTVHSSCVFFGPAVIVGVGPFSFPQLNEVEQVYQWLRRSRKGT